VRELAERAPDWMRKRASPELYIGGFTQARLDTPVLEAAGLPDVDQAARAVVFFVVTALAGGAAVARVQCGDAADPALLARAARDALGSALVRIDDENVALMRYFDLFLAPAKALPPAERRHMLKALEHATAG